MLRHPLVESLLSLRGNVRACVYTEPLWGIPFNLYAPYVSVYMRELGLIDTQIGLLITLGWILQIFTALLSGPITDRLGRKRATLIFDLISWSVPTLIWALAQNFYWFLAAALFNSLWRITMTSWNCLLVEDADPQQLVDIYAWVHIAGLLSAFFAPLAGLLINAFSLVPTMRGLYLLAFVLMTIKFIWLNAIVTETKQGRIRMLETKTQSLFSMLSGYRAVFGQVLRTPSTLYTLGIMLVMSICMMINSTFWSLLVTERLLIPPEHIAIYPFAKSSLMLVFFFLVLPRFRELPFRYPMLLGFACFVLSQLLLITIPEKSYLLLLAATFLEACGAASVNPQMDRLTVVTVDPKERARITSLLYVTVIMLASPFGWIAGSLSSINRILPFSLNIILFLIGGLLVFLAARSADRLRQRLAASQ